MSDYKKLKERYLLQRVVILIILFMLIFPFDTMAIKAPKYKPGKKPKKYFIEAVAYKLIPPDKLEPTMIISEYDDCYYPCDKMPVPYRDIRSAIHYPTAIQDPYLYGVAVIHALVDKHGQVKECIVAREPNYALLTERFVEAVENTSFQPALRDGYPVDVWIGIPVSFKLKKWDFR